MTGNDILVISGLLGLAIGFMLELYRQLLLDPVLLNGQPLPDWLEPARFLLLIGSLAVLGYGVAFKGVIEWGVGMFVLGALLAQWGAPVLVLAHDFLGIASPVGFLALLTIGLHGIVAAWGAVAYSIAASDRSS